MKLSAVKRVLLSAAAFCALMGAAVVHAADKYWVATDGNWNTTGNNWATNSGGSPTAKWVSGDNAIIEGGGGTITLDEDIRISVLNVVAPNYTITGNRLIFEGSAVYSNSVQRTIIQSGIDGSPDIYMTHSHSPGSEPELSPTALPMTVGVLYRPSDSYMKLAGSVSGNTIDRVTGGGRYKLQVQGTSTWTIQSNSVVHEFTLSSGTLIAKGELTTGHSSGFNGGTLHHNVPGVLGSDGFRFGGADLDNTSGSAITTTPNNYAYSLNADLTFIGSQGTNSDLTLGTGAVTINASRQITVSHAAATLTIGGAIGDGGVGYNLTKAGPGTLRLDGASTYVGETIVSSGTLSIAQPYMSANSFVKISAGAVLNLDYVGTNEVLGVYTNGVEGPKGTWGSMSSSADNKTALITGTGILNAPIPEAVGGIRWWDGGSSDIPAVGNELSDGGSGTWDTTIKNWDAGAGVVHTNWNSGANDLALFKGVAGTVTLAEDISLGHLKIDTAGYTIQGATLHFAPGGTITNYGNNSVTISSGITGAPDMTAYAGGHMSWTDLAPTSTSMTLGTVHRPGDCNLYLGGTTESNTIVAIPKTQNTKTHKTESSTWTINGDMWAGRLYVNSGTLICNGRLWEDGVWTMNLNGGTLIANGTLEGQGGRFDFNSGTLGGTGEVACTVTVPAGGVLAPGNPTGTMTITNYPCTINGSLDITVDGGSYSSLAVDDTLTLSGATLNVNELGTFSKPMIIATYGTLVGTFGTVNLPIGYRDEVDYTYKGQNAIAVFPPAAGMVLVIR